MDKGPGFGEQVLLSTLLANPESIAGSKGCLEVGDFLVEEHRQLYRGLCELSRVGLSPTARLLRDWLTEQGGAGSQGIDACLGVLEQVEAGSDRLRDIFGRAHAGCASKGGKASSEPTGGEGEAGGTTGGLLSRGQSHRCFGFWEPEAQGVDVSIGVAHALSDAWAVLRRRSEDGGAGLSTGFVELDRLTGGLQPGELVVLGGRPAMGKTTFALNVAKHAATRSGKTVAVFSIEMSAPEVAQRLIASYGRVDSQRLRTGQLDDEHWDRIADTIRTLKETRIFIDATPSLSTSALRWRCRRLKRDHGLDLVVVDYLQLMQLPCHDGSRSAEVAEISRGLKAMAKELDVPVLVLSQLNRSLETRASKRPMIADLRESGDIEQDADLVLLIYREEYYNKEAPEKGMAEIIVGKHRVGPTGSVRLRFLGEYASFENLGDSLAAFE